jgi:DNA-binding transcriptional ArsR family regulator
MPAPADKLFKALADPTRRALFERLASGGEHTVHALTALAGVSQPAVSKHLGVLKRAGLIIDQRNGREVHYHVQLQALLPLSDWVSLYGHEVRQVP